MIGEALHVPILLDFLFVIGEFRSSGLRRNNDIWSTRGQLRYLGAHARRIFVDNILKRVTNSLAADLRRRTASKLVFGDSAPFFALVGVSLASGTGILTKDDELEGVCWEIRVSQIEFKFNKLCLSLSLFLCIGMEYKVF